MHRSQNGAHMTKVLFHGSIEGFRGRIGNLIFRRLPDGSTVVSEAPPKKNSRQKKRAKLKRNARQKAHNERFQMASSGIIQVEVTDNVMVTKVQVAIFWRRRSDFGKGRSAPQRTELVGICVQWREPANSRRSLGFARACMPDGNITLTDQEP